MSPTPPIGRRHFCTGCLGLAGVLAAAPLRAQDTPWGIDGGTPDTPRTPRRPLVATGRPRFEGCHVSAGQGEGSPDIRFLSSCGIPYTDHAMHDELRNFMIPTYGVAPAFSFYDDSASPNAFANPEQLLGSGDGTVAYGVALIQKVVRAFYGTSQTGGLQALGAIFAHEFGHVAQFRHYREGFQPGRKAELQADFVAGWYTAIRSMQQPGRVNFPEMAREMFEIGDFQFTSPDHHGTPHERIGAYTAGVQFSLSHGGRASVTQALDTFDARFTG